MRSVETREAKSYTLGDATIFICPACGTVNPAGPSGGCPHLQLVKFVGVEEKLEDLIADVAAARRRYGELIDVLKRTVMNRVQEGKASVETPHRISAGEVDRLYSKAGETPFSLTSPGTPESPKGQLTRRKRNRTPPHNPVIDAGQLDLLAWSPPKGHA